MRSCRSEVAAADLLLALVGPSAAGKSRMAVEAASRLGAAVEIVSCDSMAVYRGLDIAADKPSLADRGGVAHHLLDLADPSEDFTAVRYRAEARAAIASIHTRGAVPMLVGGSGLWFRAVVDDLSFAPSDPHVRAELEKGDPEELWLRLEAADPATAATVDRRNVRRVIRAVEILELTGRPPSELRGEWDRREGPYRLAACGLEWARPVLYRRVAERVRREFDEGLVAEVARARASGGISRTAWQALGVKEVLEHLDGRLTLEEAIELDVRNTKRFVRRQLSWFKSDHRIVWFDASELGWDGARDAIVAYHRRAMRRA